ncbi:MAG TPA: cysteine--tRNA ligase [Candidatus Dormibacteraeota bacterium]|nr:cysteine--tRNA ligase [Candidatus Dormibacteraeota bacterium]
MSLRLYNSRTRTVEEFAPLDGKRVRIYMCGLTPSADPHLGHARSMLFFDVLRRFLEFAGYPVTYVQNVTDIDDKIIARAAEEGISWHAVVEKYYGSFVASLEQLGVRRPDVEPRATEHIPKIVEIIRGLEELGIAYETEDGVYYGVRKWPAYGKLSGRNVDDLLESVRIDGSEHKHDPLDFALWKKQKPGEPAWDSPWGPGRPGWHIECSAMSWEYLGEPFDIHGGGLDLIFPHHENEIAQTEPLLHGEPMANFWVHTGLLFFDGSKMSKSLGNFVPLEEELRRHDPRALRVLFLQIDYRKQANFTDASIEAATKGLQRLDDALAELARAGGVDRIDEQEALRVLRSPSPEASAMVHAFRDALDGDMNTAGALAALFPWLGEARALRGEAAAAAARALYGAMWVLGVAPPGDRLSGLERAATLTAEQAAGVRALAESIGASVNGGGALEWMESILAARREARQARDWARSDELRDALGAIGILVKDAKEGTTWSIAAPKD